MESVLTVQSIDIYLLDVCYAVRTDNVIDVLKPYKEAFEKIRIQQLSKLAQHMNTECQTIVNADGLVEC